ncbi:MAG: hypothetical protein ACK4KT_00805 [Thermaurantimonas sp.]
MRTAALITTLFALLLASCKKENKDLTPPAPTKFKDLNVSPNFDWNTSKILTLKFMGVTTLSPNTKGTLTVTSLPDGAELLKANHLMKDNKDFQLNIPGHIKKIRVQYGIVQKDITVKGSTVEFMPLPELKDEE